MKRQRQSERDGGKNANGFVILNRETKSFLNTVNILDSRPCTTQSLENLWKLSCVKKILLMVWVQLLCRCLVTKPRYTNNPDPVTANIAWSIQKCHAQTVSQKERLHFHDLLIFLYICLGKCKYLLEQSLMHLLFSLYFTDSPCSCCSMDRRWSSGPPPGDTAVERQGPGTVSTEPAGLYRWRPARTNAEFHRKKRMLRERKKAKRNPSLEEHSLQLSSLRMEMCSRIFVFNKDEI